MLRALLLLPALFLSSAALPRVALAQQGADSSAVTFISTIPQAQREAMGVPRLTPGERAALDRFLSDLVTAAFEKGAQAAATSSAPADFGFIPGQGYPKAMLPLATAALGCVAARSGVTTEDVLDAWDQEGREESVFATLLRIAPPGAITSAPIPSAPAGTPDVVESRIDGEFSGFDGETVFTLANGQIWQQSEYAYLYHYAYRPGVVIYRTDTGYKMKVDGVDREIGVKRIK